MLNVMNTLKNVHQPLLPGALATKIYLLRLAICEEKFFLSPQHMLTSISNPKPSDEVDKMADE